MLAAACSDSTGSDDAPRPGTFRGTLSGDVSGSFNGTALLFNNDPEQVLAAFKQMAPKDLVVLVQSTNFRLEAFRIRDGADITTATSQAEGVTVADEEQLGVGGDRRRDRGRADGPGDPRRAGQECLAARVGDHAPRRALSRRSRHRVSRG